MDAPPEPAPVSQTVTPVPEPSAASATPAATPATEPLVEPEDEKADAPPEPTGQDAPPSGDDELADFQASWQRFVNNPPAEYRRSIILALVSSGVKPVMLQADTVTLGFLHVKIKEKAEEDRNIKLLTAIVGELRGKPSQVRCVHQAEAEHIVDHLKSKYAARIVSEEIK